MEGLDKFREAFADFSDNYVIIGGTACNITMRETVVRARATHDIDMYYVNCYTFLEEPEKDWAKMVQEAKESPPAPSLFDKIGLTF